VAALGHDGVGERGFAVVDVGYDGYVAYFHGIDFEYLFKQKIVILSKGTYTSITLAPL
jgi:hypothetical protein